MRCPSCRREIPAGARSCPECERALPVPEDDVFRDGTALSSGKEASGDPVAALLAVGDLFAEHYRIEDVVGQGGMGIVYRAADTWDRDRDVCVKVIRPERVADPDAAARFIQEGSRSRWLESRHVVRVFGVSRFEDSYYITMEFLRGRTLRAWLDDAIARRRPVPLGTAHRIVRQLLTGLEEAHMADLVHRDLKPENVMLVGDPDTDDLVVKILDFGIARALDRDTSLTQAGTTMGSLVYMAPEQENAPETVGPTADLYSAGVILYEILLGSRLRAAFWRRLARLRDDVPEAVDALLEKALEDSPGARFASARDMAAALKRCVAVEVSSPPSSRRPAEKPAPSTPQRPTPPAPPVIPRAPARESKAPVARSTVDAPSSRGWVWLVVGAVAAIAGIGMIVLLLGDFDSDEGLVPSAWRPDPVALRKAERRLDAMTRTADWDDAGRNGQGQREATHVSTGLGFVLVPPGAFRMGSPTSETDRDDDGSPHRVTVGAFLLCKTECTQRAWDRIVGEDARSWKGPDLPIEEVSWTAVDAWCRKAGLRLPSESEWEYACRAGTETPFSTGATLTTDQANYDGNHPYGGGRKGVYRRRTVDAGSLPPNPWGLHEMHGNVWEWCSDAYGSGGRVFRGGGWLDIARGCRSAYRIRWSPGRRVNLLGFRPAPKVGPQNSWALGPLARAIARGSRPSKRQRRAVIRRV